MGTSAFTASLLRASADGFAGLAAGRLIESEPTLAGAGGFEAWRAHLRRQVTGLAAAVEDESLASFAAHVAWSRDAFAVRDVPPAALSAALMRLREVLEESLPGPAWAELSMYLERARSELAQRSVLTPSELPGSDAHGRLALEYVSALVACDERGAIAVVLDAIAAGRLSVRDALLRVLVPAQRELGRRWHQGDINVAEEHFGSIVTRKVLARVLSEAPATAANGRTVVVASVARDAHDFGAQVVAACFDLDGWRSLCLGADVPVGDLVAFVNRFDADLVALSATLDEQRETATRTIEALRAARPGQRVLVGGAAFAHGDELWRRVGADGYAGSAEEAVAIGRALVGA